MGQRKLENEYKDQDVLPKINKADMVGTMEAISVYLWSHCGVERAPIAYIIGKRMTVQKAYDVYPWYSPPVNKMLDKMLNLPMEQVHS